MKNRIFYAFSILASFCIAPSLATTQSIAASLAGYHKTTAVTSVAGITATSLSGIALQLPERRLYAVDNDNANIYELTSTGAVVRTLSSQGITDPEGICHYQGNEFFLAEEGGSRIMRITIPPLGTGPISGSGVPAVTLGSGWGNSGIEGVGFCAQNTTVYAVKETSPPRLYRIPLTTTGAFGTASANDPFTIEAKEGDAADICALNDGNFIIVNQEQNRLEGYGPTGALLSTLALGMTKPEGIAVDTADGTIYMVGEPREFCVFKRSTRNGNRGPVANPGFSASITRRGSREHPVLLSLSLPCRSPVTVDCVSLEGKCFQVYESILDGGNHVFPLAIKAPGRGVRLVRVASGLHRCVVIVTQP